MLWSVLGSQFLNLVISPLGFTIGYVLGYPEGHSVTLHSSVAS